MSIYTSQVDIKIGPSREAGKGLFKDLIPDEFEKLFIHI